MSLSLAFCFDAVELSATSISGNSIKVEGTGAACITACVVSVPTSRHWLTRISIPCCNLSTACVLSRVLGRAPRTTETELTAHMRSCVVDSRAAFPPSRAYNSFLVFIILMVLTGCSVLRSQPAPAPDPAITIVVAPVSLEATIRKSTQIHSFNTAPTPQDEPRIKKQLIEEVELHTQRILMEHLAKQPGFTVIPFEDTQRLQEQLNLPGRILEEREVRLLAEQAKADIVVVARIAAYGSVPWKYWAAGLATQNLIELMVVGFATGWNPAAVGGYFAIDLLLIDLPLWAGGAYIAGWAFRPVIVEVDAVQLRSCPGTIWNKQKEGIKGPGKTLDGYPPEERKLKHIQLQANLDSAMEEIAETASQKLRLQPCTEQGQPIKIRRWSLWPFSSWPF